MPGWSGGHSRNESFFLPHGKNDASWEQEDLRVDRWQNAFRPLRLSWLNYYAKLGRVSW